MFTGIIEQTGIITAIHKRAEDFSIDVKADMASGLALGQSVALDGVCLTVVKIDGAIAGFDVSAETISRTTFKTARPGDKVNMEQAMALGGRIGGHLVQGHVDCVGKITRITPSGEGYDVEVELPPDGMKYVVEKGSVAISGISLTVAVKRPGAITVAIIPHTWASTILGNTKPGSTVNIEYDMLAKYVENFVTPFITPAGKVLDKQFLERHGF